MSRSVRVPAEVVEWLVLEDLTGMSESTIRRRIREARAFAALWEMAEQAIAARMARQQATAEPIVRECLTRFRAAESGAAVCDRFWPWVTALPEAEQIHYVPALAVLEPARMVALLKAVEGHPPTMSVVTSADPETA